MANNRMWLRCGNCGAEKLLAKYYPTITDGWFLFTGPVRPVEMADLTLPKEPSEEEMQAVFVRHITAWREFNKEWDDFLEAHSYCDTPDRRRTMYGNRRWELRFEKPE